MSGPARSGRGLAAAIDATAESGPDHSRLVDRADEPADYGHWRRHFTWPAVAVVVGTFAMGAGGIEWWRAFALSMGIAIALWSVIATMAVPDVSWHDDVPGERYRSSTPWEVPGLTSARESDDSFARHLRPRLWQLAMVLLARRGIDPDSAAARDLIGAEQYALLTGADTDPRRVTSSVSVLCQTIAALAVSDAPGSRAPLRAPSLAGLAGPTRTRALRGRPRHDHPSKNPRKG